MNEQPEDKFIDELITTEAHDDIPQFNASTMVTPQQQKEVLRDQNDSYKNTYLRDSDSTMVLLDFEWLLAINPALIASVNEDIKSKIVNTALDKYPRLLYEGAEWLFICRLFSPEQIPTVQYSGIFFESSLQSGDLDPSSTLDLLAKLAVFAPENARSLATDEKWNKIKKYLEQEYMDTKSQNLAGSRVFLPAYIKRLQLAFPGRIRELSFFKDWYLYQAKQFQESKQNIQEDIPDLLHAALIQAYDLTLLTSDGIEVTEDGGLRIIPHQPITTQHISNPPTDYV